MPPLRIGLLFFIGVSHHGLHLSRCDKYLTPRPAALAAVPETAAAGAIYCVKQSQRSPLLYRSEGEAYTPRAISQTRIFESIGSTLLCRRLEAHYIHSTGFISAPTVH